MKTTTPADRLKEYRHHLKQVKSLVDTATGIVFLYLGDNSNEKQLKKVFKLLRDADRQYFRALEKIRNVNRWRKGLNW